MRPLATTKEVIPWESKTNAPSIASVLRRLVYSKWFSFASIIVVFLAIISAIPLSSCVKIGADEDFELSKATLVNHGFKLYSEIWDDQPPLDTFLIAKLSRTVSSALIPRMMTVSFAMVLLGSFFLVVQQVSGLRSGLLSAGIVVASPGFLELASSAMQEIPALALVVLSLWFVFGCANPLAWASAVFAGLSFGIALQLKLIGVIYLPLIALGFWTRTNQSIGKTAVLGLIFTLVTSGTFFAMNALTGNPLLMQFQTSWSAHFASAQYFKYGSPSDHPYDWWILLRNWDTSIPAFIGGVLIWRKSLKTNCTLLLPVIWLLLTLIVFPVHKPWWGYYYIHNALPLSWCAAEGFLGVFGLLANARVTALKLCFATFAACVLVWSCARMYLEISDIRSSSQLYSCQVLKEISRFKPFSKFLFADQPIYTFYSQIPMPPHLAVISMKRIWSGDMTEERLRSELQQTKPSLVLRNNDGAEVPYQDLLEQEYRLVYRDQEFKLYAHKSISKLGR